MKHLELQVVQGIWGMMGRLNLLLMKRCSIKEEHLGRKPRVRVAYNPRRNNGRMGRKQDILQRQYADTHAYVKRRTGQRQKLRESGIGYVARGHKRW